SSATGTASTATTSPPMAAANTAAPRSPAASANSSGRSGRGAFPSAWLTRCDPRLGRLARRAVHEPGPRRHLVRRLLRGAAAYPAGVGTLGTRSGDDPGRLPPRLSHLALHRRLHHRS